MKYFIVKTFHSKMLIEQFNSQFSEINVIMKATKEKINNIDDDDLIDNI